VPHHVGPVPARGVEEAAHVRGEALQVVGAHGGRGVAAVVAALVGHQDAVAGLGEWADLLTPAVPELREAVEQHHERAALGPGGPHVQPHVAALDPVAFEGHRKAISRVGHGGRTESCSGMYVGLWWGWM
jgi:hypothetical protein